MFDFIAVSDCFKFRYRTIKIFAADEINQSKIPTNVANDIPNINPAAPPISENN